MLNSFWFNRLAALERRKELSMKVKGLNRLFRFSDYRIEEVNFGIDILVVRLRHDKRKLFRCQKCNAACRVESQENRTARDMPFGPAERALIMYPAFRVFCRHCRKSHWHTPPEIDTRRKATRRLLQHALRLANILPLSSVAELLKLDDRRLGRWDRSLLAEYLPKPNYENLRLLMVDEKSIGKGHQYVTVVLNGETGELLHLHEGKKKASLKAFFDKLTAAQKACIQAVCVDRAGAYLECIKAELPHVELVFDKFHLVLNFNEIINKIRREEWNKARASKDDAAAKVIKGQRFNLLRRPEKNTEKQQNRLQELLAMNETLSKAYMLLEDFRDALSQRYICDCQWALRLWFETAMQSGIEKLRRFAARLKPRLREIVNAIRFKLTNGLIEGFNNKIARIIHRACGQRDAQYLFLKLRQVSLPKPLQVPVIQK